MNTILKYKNALIILVMLFISGQSLAQYSVQAVYPVKGPGCNGGFEFKAGGSAFPLDIYIIQSFRDLLQNSFEDESELAKLPFSGKLFQDLKYASDDFLQYVLSHTGQFHSYDLLKAFPSLRTDVKILKALDAAVVGKSPAEIADLVKILNGKTEKEARELIDIYNRTNGKFVDDLVLDNVKNFADNALGILDAGLEFWKAFQNTVARQLRILNPCRNIGSQVYLDFHVTVNGVPKMITVIPDNLIQIEANGIKTYKIIDAKASIKEELTILADLTPKLTDPQKTAYVLADGQSIPGIILQKVEMKGTQARATFPLEFSNGIQKVQINLELGVEYWVNKSKTSVEDYLIRPRKY